jgi:hypothetical protein
MTPSFIVFLDMLYIGEIKALVELHEMYVKFGMKGKKLWDLSLAYVLCLCMYRISL